MQVLQYWVHVYLYGYWGPWWQRLLGSSYFFFFFLIFTCGRKFCHTWISWKLWCLDTQHSSRSRILGSGSHQATAVLWSWGKVHLLQQQCWYVQLCNRIGFGSLGFTAVTQELELGGGDAATIHTADCGSKTMPAQLGDGGSKL